MKTTRTFIVFATCLQHSNIFAVFNIAAIESLARQKHTSSPFIQDLDFLSRAIASGADMPMSSGVDNSVISAAALLAS